MITMRPTDRERVVAIIRRHLPNVEILAYGSRVRGDCHSGSDLDVAVRAPDRRPVATEALFAAVEELRDSNIPILVELRDWARLPTAFQQEIERQYESL